MANYLLLRVLLPEGYDDVHPEIVVDDLRIASGFDVEILDPSLIDECNEG